MGWNEPFAQLPSRTIEEVSVNKGSRDGSGRTARKHGFQVQFVVLYLIYSDLYFISEAAKTFEPGSCTRHILTCPVYRGNVLTLFVAPAHVSHRLGNTRFHLRDVTNKDCLWAGITEAWT